MSPTKVRLAADLVRGLPVEKAMDQLMYCKKWAAKPMRQLLQSAIANASHNYRLTAEQLFIKELRVDMGTTLHRWTPRAHGRAYPIRKKVSHIEMVLEVMPVLAGEEKEAKEIVDAVSSAAKLEMKEEGRKTSDAQGQELAIEAKAKVTQEVPKSHEINPRSRGKHRSQQHSDKRRLKKSEQEKKSRILKEK